MKLIESELMFIIDSFIPEPSQLYQILLNSISWNDRIKSRKEASFGVPYNYSGAIWPEMAFPASLLPTLDLVSAQIGYRPNNCLALFYPNKNSTMGYHFDEIDQLASGTGITVVSLGAERQMSFQHQKSKEEEHYLLKNGSLLFMSAEMQSVWKHGLLADKTVTGGRISLAFRSVV